MYKVNCCNQAIPEALLDGLRFKISVVGIVGRNMCNQHMLEPSMAL